MTDQATRAKLRTGEIPWRELQRSGELDERVKLFNKRGLCGPWVLGGPGCWTRILLMHWSIDKSEEEDVYERVEEEDEDGNSWIDDYLYIHRFGSRYGGLRYQDWEKANNYRRLLSEWIK